MSTANATNGSAIEPRAAQEPTSQAPASRSPAGLHEDQGLLLAQIPDLDPKTTPMAPGKRFDGRIISQALSVKLVFGVGIGLVIGAILPYLFGKVSRPEAHVTELPAWASNGGSTGNTSQTTAPTWPGAVTAPSAATVSPPTSPVVAPAIVPPQAPQFGDNRPMALTEPAWPQPRTSGTPMPVATPSPAASNYINPPVANVNSADNRGSYRGFDRAVDPRNLQADNRNDPAAQYRNNDTRYDYRGNSAETASAHRDVPANGLVRDTRYDNVSNGYPPATSQGSPLMPSGTPGPTANYREPPISDPGVARFDGTINTPPYQVKP